MDNEAIYQERLSRIEKAIHLEQVDRIPVVYQGPAFPPHFSGKSMGKFCLDPDFALDVTLSTLDRFQGFDGVNAHQGGVIPAMLSFQWLSRIAIPGRDLPENSLWQVHESGLMTVEDYDMIVNKGWNAFLDYFLPKIVDMSLMKANQDWMVAKLPTVLKRFREHGLVLITGGLTTIPFEFFCGGRSMQQFFLDLYRIPDRVKAAMDVVLPDLIQFGINGAKLSGAKRIWVGGWRAASQLLAPKLWDKFVFPYYYEMVNALAENGVMSVLHFDQDWTRDLKRLLELPAKKCLFNPDGMTDIRKAKEILGHHMAIMGDVPASLFAMGTPEDIYKYVKDLVRDIGPTGLILAPGCDAPINTRPENMEAFLAAGQELGVVTSRG
jgi:uroporphyrinogen-III decarboxylase